MKKIFLMLAAAGMLFSSCQKDENLGGANSGEALVTVTASVPQAVGTRAAAAYTDSAMGGVKNVSDADYDLRFILKIYEGETVVKEDQWTGEIATLAHQKQYRLVPGHNYTFVVWADIVAEDTDADLYYNTQSFPEITEAEGKHAINDEARDAYFVTKTVEVGENANVDLTLKRPFGKVRVVTTDWAEDAVQNGGAPTAVTITYNDVDVYGGINIKTGKLLASTKATNAYTADINNYSADAEGEKTLYVDYIWGLPATEGASATAVEQYPIHFTIATSIRTYEVKADVPVTRNWLTTVKGNILTSNTNVNINTDPNFGGNHEVALWDGSIKEVTPVDDVYTITTAAELAWVAQQVNAGDTFDGKTVKLAENINLNDMAWTPIGSKSTFEGTFDGQGKTISKLKATTTETDVYLGLFGLVGGEVKNFTIDGATISGVTNKGKGVVAGTLYPSGKANGVTVKNAVVTGNRQMGGIVGYSYGSVTNCTVDGITLTATPDQLSGSYDNGDKVGGAIGLMGEGNYTISGNTVKNFTIKGFRDLGGVIGYSQANNTISNNRAENGVITVDQTTGHYETSKSTNAGEVIGHKSSTATFSENTSENVKIGVATAEDLQKMLNEATSDATIILAGNITGNVQVTEKQDVTITIDGNGNKYDGQISIYGNSSYTNSTLILKNINFETSTAYQDFIFAFNSGNGDYSRYPDNVTVENCTFTAVAGSAAVHTAVGAKFKANQGIIKMVGCTATNMHTLMQSESSNKGFVSVEGATVINGKNGVSFNNTMVAKISNSTITATGDGSYGVRANGAVAGYGLTVSNCTISAFVPVLVRNMTATSYTATLEGTNTLTASGTNPYQVVFCNVDYDGTAALVAPTGTYTLTGADNFNVYPIADNTKPVYANSATQMTTLLQAGATNLVLGEGTYDLPTAVSGKTLKISGGKDVVINTNVNPNVQAYNSTTITFDGVTVQGVHNKDSFNGYAVYNQLTFTNCDLVDMVTLYGPAKFSGCTFTTTGDVYAIKTWGGKEVTVEGCTFNTQGRAILYYPGSNVSGETNVTVSGCTFKDDEKRSDDKAAIEVADDYPNQNVIFNLTISNTPVTGFSVTAQSSKTYGGTSLGTTLWGNKNLIPASRLNVKVDGVDVY